MYKYNHIIILIMDGVGCGVREDYKQYHEMESNTLKAVYEGNSGFSLPTLEKLGLSKILFNKEIDKPYCAGIIRAESVGNDTYSSIWEMLGIPIKKRFYSEKAGFGKELIYQIEKSLGVKIIGNEYIAGFKAMEKYFDIHQKTGGVLLYFAEDGIVLLAAHEKVIRPEILNIMGEKLATILEDKNVVRIITRPFIGEPGNFTRSKNRQDFVIAKNPYHESALFELWRKDVDILTTEHIYGILGKPNHVQAIKGNHDNNTWLEIVNDAIKNEGNQALMIFVLQDFDTMGHKKDTQGFAQKLIEFDNYLPKIVNNLATDDLLILTADHGCNPTIDIRGHNREKVPLIIYNKNNEQPKWLGERNTFADIGQTIRYNYRMPPIKLGKPILEIL